MKYLKEWEEYNQRNSKHNIDRGLHSGDFELLIDCISKLKSGDNYLEIGVSAGSSLLGMSIFRPDINCYGIENEQKSVEEVIKKEKIDNAHFIFGNSSDVCKEWKKEIHMLFIDGDHTLPQIAFDVIGWLPFVVKEGMILFHDYEEDVKKVVDILRYHEKYSFYDSSVEYQTSMPLIKKL